MYLYSNTPARDCVGNLPLLSIRQRGTFGGAVASPLLACKTPPGYRGVASTLVGCQWEHAPFIDEVLIFRLKSSGKRLHARRLPDESTRNTRSTWLSILFSSVVFSPSEREDRQYHFRLVLRCGQRNTRAKKAFASAPGLTANRCRARAIYIHTTQYVARRRVGDAPSPSPIVHNWHAILHPKVDGVPMEARHIGRGRFYFF